MINLFEYLQIEDLPIELQEYIKSEGKKDLSAVTLDDFYKVFMGTQLYLRDLTPILRLRYIQNNCHKITAHQIHKEFGISIRHSQKLLAQAKSICSANRKSNIQEKGMFDDY